MQALIKRSGAPGLRAGLAAVLAVGLLGAAQDSPAQHKTHTVVIEAMQFSPATLEVRAGDTVIWQNKDAFPHTATAENRSFDSGSIAYERSWKYKANKKGVFPYVCSLHPSMKGTLVVK